MEKGADNKHSAPAESSFFAHMPPERITSLQNPRIKHLVRLRDGHHRRRQGSFLIEGLRETSRALDTQWRLQTLYFSPECFPAADADHWDLLRRAEDLHIELVQLSPEAFAKAAFREGPDGILAVAECRPLTLDELALPAAPLFLVAEQIEKPGNLGALLRTADAAGASACIVADARTDIYNPAVIRASQGAFFSLPVVSTDNTTARLWLEERGVRLVTTTPHTDRTLWDVDLTGPTAIVVGAEDTGVSADWTGPEVTTVSIPMRGASDSLNVSAAAAVALFEAVRQRRA